MSATPEPDQAAPRAHLDPGAARKRRLAEVFGDVLPESTTDDRDPEPTLTDDHWLIENRPPHHGG
jgi:hypothetical protein